MLNYNKNKKKFDFDRIQLMRSKSERFIYNSSSSELTPEKKVQQNNSQSHQSGDDKTDLVNEQKVALLADDGNVDEVQKFS